MGMLVDRYTVCIGIWTHVLLNEYCICMLNGWMIYHIKCVTIDLFIVKKPHELSWRKTLTGSAVDIDLLSG